MVLREEKLQAIAESSLSAGENPRLAQLAGNLKAVREALGQLLDDQPNLLLHMQYPQALGTLHRLGIIDATGLPHMGGQRVPDFETMKEQFSGDQLQAATSKQLIHPRLLLVPDWDAETCLSMIDAHRVPGQNPTEMDASLKQGKRRRQISLWQPVIVDASKGPTGKVHTHPATGENLNDFMIHTLRQHRETSGPIDVRIYTMLLLSVLSTAKRIEDLIDVKSTTILSGEVGSADRDHVPVAKFLRKDSVLCRDVNCVRFAPYDIFGRGEAFDPGAHWMRPTIIGNRI